MPQDKLREESQFFAQDKLCEESRPPTTNETLRFTQGDKTEGFRVTFLDTFSIESNQQRGKDSIVDTQNR
jgi:hypothetical protein